MLGSATNRSAPTIVEAGQLPAEQLSARLPPCSIRMTDALAPTTPRAGETPIIRRGERDVGWLDGCVPSSVRAEGDAISRTAASTREVLARSIGSTLKGRRRVLPSQLRRDASCRGEQPSGLAVEWRVSRPRLEGASHQPRHQPRPHDRERRVRRALRRREKLPTLRVRARVKNARVIDQMLTRSSLSAAATSDRPIAPPVPADAASWISRARWRYFCARSSVQASAHGACDCRRLAGDQLTRVTQRVLL